MQQSQKIVTPTAARRALKRKAGTLEGVYYAIGVQVPPRHGSEFSMRYTTVASARAGWQLLRERMLKKRRGMVGELILAIAHRSHTVSLGGYIRRGPGELERFAGDVNRGAVMRFRGNPAHATTVRASQQTAR
jgi:hypothetical protein